MAQDLGEKPIERGVAGEGLELTEERVAAFSARMVELSAGACRAVELGEAFQPVPIK